MYKGILRVISTRAMILEELVSVFVSIMSGLCNGVSKMSRESLLQREGYQPETELDLPYCEEYDLIESREQPRRTSYESFFRSLKANVGILIAVVFISSFLAIGAVLVDLNTSDACKEWTQKNVTVRLRVQTLEIVGASLRLLPFIMWFPTSVVMLWGFKEFKKNYLLCLCVCQLVTGSINCAYRIVMFKKFVTVNGSFFPYRYRYVKYIDLIKALSLC